jgi:hypothetical protein
LVCYLTQTRQFGKKIQKNNLVAEEEVSTMILSFILDSRVFIKTIKDIYKSTPIYGKS